MEPKHLEGSGLYLLALDAPESLGTALALATTVGDKSKFITALCQNTKDGWTGIARIARDAPTSLDKALALATTVGDK